MATSGPINDPYTDRRGGIDDEATATGRSTSDDTGSSQQRAKSPPILSPMHGSQRDNSRHCDHSLESTRTTSGGKKRGAPSTLADARNTLRQLDQQLNADDKNDQASDEKSSSSSDENADEDATFKRAFLAMQTTAINDSDFKPKQFSGNSADIDHDVDRWIEHFKTYVKIRGINSTVKLQLLKLLMIGEAADWLRTVPKAVSNDYKLLLAAFREQYAPNDLQRWHKAATMW